MLELIASAAIGNANYSVSLAKPWKSVVDTQEAPYSHRQNWQAWLVGKEQSSNDFDLEKLAAFGYLSYQKSSNLTSEIEIALNQLFGKRIIISKPAQIRGYLLRYPDMVDLLVLVCETALEKFGISTYYSLELYRDPEIDDEYLTLYVRQENYSPNILNRIEAIMAEVASEFVGKSGWILVTTDFQPAR